MATTKKPAFPGKPVLGGRRAMPGKRVMTKRVLQGREIVDVPVTMKKKPAKFLDPMTSPLPKQSKTPKPRNEAEAKALKASAEKARDRVLKFLGEADSTLSLDAAYDLAGGLELCSPRQQERFKALRKAYASVLGDDPS
jgi:hypothetical protein